MAAFLRADQGQAFIFGIQGDAVAQGVPERHLLPEPQHALFLVRGIAVIFGVLGAAGEFVNDAAGRGLHGVADGKADDVDAVGLGPGDFFSEFHEQVRRNFRQTVGCLHYGSPYFFMTVS